jgi:hypothetical protein
MKAFAIKKVLKIQSSIGHLAWLQEAAQSFRTADPILGLRGQLDGQSVVALNQSLHRKNENERGTVDMYV